MLYILAHAGHGVTEGHSLFHYLVEPSHLPFTLMGVAVVIGLGVWAFGKVRARH